MFHKFLICTHLSAVHSLVLTSRGLGLVRTSHEVMLACPGFHDLLVDVAVLSDRSSSSEHKQKVEGRAWSINRGFEYSPWVGRGTRTWYCTALTHWFKAQPDRLFRKKVTRPAERTSCSKWKRCDSKERVSHAAVTQRTGLLLPNHVS